MKKQERKEKFETLRSKILRKKYVSILLAVFTLGVNIFAWFAFSANAGLQLEGTVASWDVYFKDGNGESIHNAIVEVSKMKPGMADFNKTVYIENKSDVDAEFRYEINSFSILGRTVDFSNSNDRINYLRTNYPFVVSFTPSKVNLDSGENMTFDMDVSWDYESTTPKYYKLDYIYEYDDSFVYYKVNNANYEEFSVPDITTYNVNRNNLYLEKDDADTYFGMQCNSYEKATGQACFIVNLKLMVVQRNA